ncbi:tannase/feruloyl esterase family alpha/beta hydrolase [Sphingomonas soli]|uniref:tannase/feruloyl esterase family alpha/beta hydrolase n=1 Tax=Sphingomonas soli TaxID=266127 RepID=UPI00082FAA11|nr:tannase/feruloyl esterase family alpha/beta hydrolase [Sphingomonas soli]
MLTALVTGCAALAGAHSGGVTVVQATMVAPAPDWTPVTTSFYRPQPVRVPLCRVEGNIEGNIGFELWLPANWNGRLLGAGVGGDAGVFNYSDMSRRVEQGFATVTTDSGHKQSEARWMSNTKARVDYEHRASHLTAQAAKALAQKFYGRPVDKSYYLGCSGGGRQALKEMQNYPGDYDGVIAGAPGPYMPLQSVRMMWGALLQKHDPAGALSDEDWALYERKAIATCDRKDGVADGIIENPLRCTFRIKTLACKPGQTSDCLSKPKLAMLDRIVRPMPDERGNAMDWGLYPGVRTRPGPPSPLLRAMWADGVYNDPNWNEDSFRRSADLAAANRLMPELRADKIAIQPFLKSGGKAILYQGWADPSTNAGPTIGYFASLSHAYPNVDQSVRLFMVPGMYHCARGPGADSFGGSGHPVVSEDPERDVLWALVRWVEQGKAPERLIATKLEGDRPRFTRALCPFPQAARYDGGPQDDAASYSCKTDPALVRELSRKVPR